MLSAAYFRKDISAYSEHDGDVDGETTIRPGVRRVPADQEDQLWESVVSGTKWPIRSR